MTYTAGASLLRPIVRKNSDISWKQSSSTLSTVCLSSAGQSPDMAVPQSPRAKADMRTSVLFQCFAMLCADDIQEVHLSNDLLVQFEDVMRLDVR